MKENIPRKSPDLDCISPLSETISETQIIRLDRQIDQFAELQRRLMKIQKNTRLSRVFLFLDLFLWKMIDFLGNQLYSKYISLLGLLLPSIASRLIRRVSMSRYFVLSLQNILSMISKTSCSDSIGAIILSTHHLYHISDRSMRVTYHKQFEKDLDRFASPEQIRTIFQWIDGVEKVSRLSDLQNIKKLSGFIEYYRVRFGEFRLGFRRLDSGEIQLDRFLHRKDIYKKYP